MKSKKIDPIAQRILMHGDSHVIVSIGSPEKADGDFACHYSIVGNDVERFGYAMGMDSVQALQLAMKSIDIDLSSMARSSGRDFTWLDDMPGQTGFPSFRDNDIR